LIFKLDRERKREEREGRREKREREREREKSSLVFKITVKLYFKQRLNNESSN